MFKPVQKSLLQPRLEIGENEIAAQYEMKGAVWDGISHILLAEFRWPGELSVEAIAVICM